MVKKIKKKTARKAATKPVEKPAPTPDEAPVWSFVAFGDLHAQAKTFDRALRTLAFIREQTVARHAEIPRPSVLCLGDFWDLRGVLSVRHVHDLCDEFDRWEQAHMHMRMIPGNHDQVDRNGLIHGLRIFNQYPNIQVITDPWVSGVERCAFIPWRDDTALQRQLFADVPDGFTVFGHAEAPGATANNGHVMEGKFDLRPGPRAIYLSHFHKRQVFGNVFYLGSPFEQNFGERDEEHGIAIIRSDRIEPEWLPVPGMPKHYVFMYPEEVSKFRSPDKHDIVQVEVEIDDINTDEFKEAVKLVTADDVRTVPYIEEGDEAELNANTLTLDNALLAYVEEYVPEVEMDAEALLKFGRDILAMVPEAGRIVPMAPEVRIEKVGIRGFCKIQEKVTIDLDDKGAVLLRGAMGVGKTSLCDAITWCLYGRTTPRKPGEAGAQLKADQIINDECKECVVDVTLRAGDKRFIIVRTKTRGKGAVIQLYQWLKDPSKEQEEAVDMSSGVLDAQDQIHSLIGMDYDLWRTCVYLGQGAVANFVTDADKARKDLLSRAFGLGVCPYALKLVKKTRAPVRSEIEGYEGQIVLLQNTVSAKQQINFDAESVRWETDRQAAMQGARDQIEKLKNQVEEWDEHLKGETQWLQAKDHAETEVRVHMDQLTKSSNEGRKSEIREQLGGLKAELGGIGRELTALKANYARSQQTATGVCGECGQALPQDQWENYIGEMERKIEGKQSEQKTRETQMSNLVLELGELEVEGTSNSDSVKAQLADANERLGKAQQALGAIQTIKTRREGGVREWERFRDLVQTQQSATNPFEVHKRERDVEVLKLQGEIDELETKLTEKRGQDAAMEYWETAFGPKGLPVLVLRTAMGELEAYANRFLADLVGGSIQVRLHMEGEDLEITYFELKKGEWRERDYKQLSGGQRRCVELAFVPFALSEMVFNRIGLRVMLLIIDELTTHMDPSTKPLACEILQRINRETIMVIDHDVGVQGMFDKVWEVTDGGRIAA